MKKIDYMKPPDKNTPVEEFHCGCLRCGNEMSICDRCLYRISERQAMLRICKKIRGSKQ